MGGLRFQNEVKDEVEHGSGLDLLMLRCEREA